MEEKTPTDETVTTPPESDAAPAAEAPATESPAADEGDVPAEAANVAVVGTPQEKVNFLNQLSQDSVYLMGLSFLVGVLFTVFILLVFDFMRRNASDTTTTTTK